MGPREGIDVEAAAGMLAVPLAPEKAYGPALQEVGDDEAPDHEQVEGLRGPHGAAELWVGEEPQVQEQDGSLDQPEGQRVEHLEDEEDLEELCDPPGLESPDVPAQAVAFFEDTPGEPAGSEELWMSMIVSMIIFSSV